MTKRRLDGTHNDPHGVTYASRQQARDYADELEQGGTGWHKPVIVKIDDDEEPETAPRIQVRELSEDDDSFDFER